MRRIRKIVDSKFEMHKRYYSILFAANDIHVAKRELELVAFISLRGNLYNKPNINDFCKEFNTSKHTIYNSVNKLVKLDILNRKKRKSLVVNPLLLPKSTPIGVVVGIGVKKEGNKGTNKQ